ncbi:MAG: ATP-binding cassette domain-containing protein [Tissierellia bacterium]|nr:ATP-binding cassette domain-containing protein [Tissierellia bacterium]
MQLIFKGIKKSYGKNEVLKGLDFTVNSGKPMGFLGRNGAGKTTLIRCLMDVFKPDSGEILLDNKPISKSRVKFGYLPEERGMYAKEKILEQLIYFGMLRGGKKQECKDSARKLLDKVGLLEYQDKKLETLSKGNQQKVQICEALINDPDIIVMDEPFSGLDPVNSKLLKDIILEIIGKDKIMFFSAHQMSYVEEICEDITIINGGNVVLTGNLDNIKREIGKNRIRLKSDKLSDEDLYSYISTEIEGIDIEKDENSLIVSPISIDKNELLTELLRLNVSVETFDSYRPSMQDIFIRYTGEIA